MLPLPLRSRQALSAILCAFLISESDSEGGRGEKKEVSFLTLSLTLLRNASLCLRVTSPPPSLPPIAWSSGTVGGTVGRAVGHGENKWNGRMKVGEGGRGDGEEKAEEEREKSWEGGNH